MPATSLSMGRECDIREHLAEISLAPSCDRCSLARPRVPSEPDLFISANPGDSSDVLLDLDLDLDLVLDLEILDSAHPRQHANDRS
jgi:hypothetical protein